METSNNIEHDQMETIRVRKLNHSTLRLECDRGVGAELREFFSFFVPGYRFMPAYKNRLWDGKIRLYNQITGEILAGLFPQVLSFAESREYELEIEETEYGNPNEGNEINADFINKYFGEQKMSVEDAGVQWLRSTVASYNQYYKIMNQKLNPYNANYKKTDARLNCPNS